MYALLLLFVVARCQANTNPYLQKIVESHGDKLSSLVPYQARTDAVYHWFEENRQAIHDVLHWFDTQDEWGNLNEKLTNLENRVAQAEDRLTFTNQGPDKEDLRVLEMEESMEERSRDLVKLRDHLENVDKKLEGLENSYNSSVRLSHEEKIAAIEEKLTRLENMLEKHDNILEGSGSGPFSPNLKESKQLQLEDLLEAHLRNATTTYERDKEILSNETQDKLSTAIQNLQSEMKAYADNQIVQVMGIMDRKLEQSMQKATSFQQEMSKLTNIIKAKQDQLTLLLTNHTAELSKMRIDVSLLTNDAKRTGDRLDTGYRNLSTQLNKLAAEVAWRSDWKPMIQPPLPPQPLRLEPEKVTTAKPILTKPSATPFPFLVTKATRSMGEVWRSYFGKTRSPNQDQ